ncbi:MAG: hypothetical protein FWD78_06730 [Treponema sp.]|nr:hypothetical protein [Treponema sp.]
MAKKEKAVYAPGELGKVRDKLGNIDNNEAKRMANVLGGEVGYERTEDQEKTKNKPKTRHERVNVKIGGQPMGRTPSHRVELAPEEEQAPKEQKNTNPGDDPSVYKKPGYWERIKMDRYAGQSQFDIKSGGQVIFSMLSVLGEINDFVNPHFITTRMKEYYRQLELATVSTRSMFPRNNIRRNERMKKTAPMAFAVLDTIRYWNIEKISSEMARLQARPRNVRVADCAEIIRMVYRPLFILEKMDMEAHIRTAYKILYKALYIENPMDAQNKFQDQIRTALSSFADVRRDVHFLMYPILMKSISSKFYTYEQFFTEQRKRIMAFLKVSETDQIDPTQSIVPVNTESANTPPPEDELTVIEEEKEETPEEQTKRTASEAERKALDRGLITLEALFPNAGWDRMSTYPDLYPYFVDVFDLRKGLVNIAPTDPLQQIYIHMRIIEELFYGLRFVSFGAVRGPDGNPEEISDKLTEIINNWHYYTEMSFEKEYLPRLSEYIRLLEGSPEEWNSPYTKKVVSDLHWTKRLYYLPFYKFESMSPPPFQKKDIVQIYPEVKRLRRYLAAVGAGIEMGNRSGGAEKFARCEGINNPWEPYNFQVPNPLSERLNALLAPKNRTNASLVFFTLAAITVLDYLVNNEESWAYENRPGPLFRSVDGEGIVPLTGIDTRIDAEALFKASLKKRQSASGQKPQ